MPEALALSRRNAIVFATDRKLFPAAAFQAACLDALGTPSDTDVLIATESAEDARVASEFGIPFRPLIMDASLVSRLRMQGVSLSPATYYRVFLPGLLAGDYRRVLYLDVDIYIHSSKLSRIFEVPMQGHAAGAIRDLIIYRDRTRAEEREVQQTITGTDDKYLNSGVLLFDCDRFVEERLEARILEVVASRPLWLHDQSALNVVLDGNWLELSPSFNMFIPLWESHVANVCEPIVVHFPGPTKPWHGPSFQRNHPARSHMERFFMKSPWRSFLAQFYDINDALKRLKGVKPKHTRGGRFDPVTNAPFLQHLRTTRFADVEAGLTTLRLEYLPARRAPEIAR